MMGVVEHPYHPFEIECVVAASSEEFERLWYAQNRPVRMGDVSIGAAAAWTRSTSPPRSGTPRSR